MDKNNIDDILKSMSEKDINNLVNYIFRDNKSKINTAKSGLANLGCQCYMDAALQCLINVGPLAAFFASDLPKNDFSEVAEAFKKDNKEIDDRQKEYERLACAFGEFVKEYHSGSNNLKNNGPVNFKKAIEATKEIMDSKFRGHGQQDSHEFIGMFVGDALGESVNKCKRPKPYVELNIKDGETESQYYKRVKEYNKSRMDSFSSSLFTGFYKSVCECPECNCKSISFDPYNDLNIQIAKGEKKIEKGQEINKTSIKDCLNESTDDQIDFYCSPCKKHVKAKKRMTLYDLPDYLMIKPNRFEKDSHGEYSKDESKIDFDLDNFSLDDYVSNPELKNKNIKYELTGVVCHYGGTGGGHYTAYCKKGDKWFWFDDSSVSEVSEETVRNLKKDGYVFFYRRKDIDYAKIFEGYDLKVLIKSLISNGILEKEYIVNWFENTTAGKKKKEEDKATKIQSVYRGHIGRIKRKKEEEKVRIEKLKADTDDEIKRLVDSNLSFRFDKSSKKFIFELGGTNFSGGKLKNKGGLKYLNKKELNKNDEVDINTEELKSVKDKVISDAKKIFNNLLAQAFSVSGSTKKFADILAKLNLNELNEMFKLDKLKKLEEDPQEFIDLISKVISKLGPGTDGLNILTEKEISELGLDQTKLADTMKNISMKYNNETKKLEFGIPIAGSSVLSIGSGIAGAVTGSAMAAPALAVGAGVVAVVFVIILVVRHYKRKSKANEMLNNILKAFFGDENNKDNKNSKDVKSHIPKSVYDFIEKKSKSQRQRN